MDPPAPSPPQATLVTASTVNLHRDPKRWTRNHLGRFSKRAEQGSSLQQPSQSISTQDAKLTKSPKKPSRKSPSEVPEFIRNSVTGLPMPNPKHREYTVNLRRELYPGASPGEKYRTPDVPWIDKTAYAVSTRHVPPPEAPGYNQDHLGEIIVQRKAAMDNDEHGAARLGDRTDEEYAMRGVEAFLTSVQKVPSERSMDGDEGDLADDEMDGDCFQHEVEYEENESYESYENVEGDGETNEHGDDEVSASPSLSNEIFLGRTFEGRSRSSRC